MDNKMNKLEEQIKKLYLAYKLGKISRARYDGLIAALKEKLRRQREELLEWEDDMDDAQYGDY